MSTTSIRISIIGAIAALATLWLVAKFVTSERPADYVTNLEFNKKLADETNGKTLRDVTVFWGNDTSRKFRLAQTINERTLVFRFSGMMCDACIEHGILKLRQNYRDYTSENIILLASEVNPKLRNDYYDKQMLSFDGERLELPLEDYFVPYFFVTDKDLRVRGVFIPDRQNDEETEAYLSRIKSVVSIE